MQGLAAAADQALTPGQAEIGIADIGLGQFPQRLLLVKLRLR